MEAFESLDVWKRAGSLSVDVYQLVSDCKDYGFKDQIFRSALSVPSNIAEGYERGSRKEYVRFLHIAKGSCAELRTQLYIGIKASILEKSRTSRCVKEAIELSKMLQGLISSLQRP